MEDDFMTTTYLNPSMFPQKDVRIYGHVVITTALYCVLNGHILFYRVLIQDYMVEQVAQLNLLNNKRLLIYPHL